MFAFFVVLLSFFRSTFETSFTEFIEAVQRGDLHIITAMIAENPSLVNEVDEHGRTTLNDQQGKTALMYASEEVRWFSIDVLGVLISSNADVNRVDQNGKSALYYALENVDGQTARVLGALIKNKIDVNHMDQNGKTALMYALE
jgi:ankyrin repeat protein